MRQIQVARDILAKTLPRYADASSSSSSSSLPSPSLCSSIASNARHLSTLATETNAVTKSPIVIVGGGPTGLLLSILLSQYNVPSTIIEARTPPQIHRHPQAHYLNLRTMEILKHYVPHVYQNVVNSMAPVEDWEGFTFGSSVLGRQIARVVHPVRHGIGIGQDGNGILVQDGHVGLKTSKEEEVGLRRCSVCNPGHLAQNKFASILLDEARRMSAYVEGTSILHGDPVLSIQENDGGSSYAHPLTIHTTSGKILQAQYVIAAEGANSLTRTQHGGPNILAGSPSMQNLINVHFQTSMKLSKRLMERRETVGMLHFVFHKEVVGAFVCHDLNRGEWVLQIPYFPPFQDISDFSMDRVREIVKAGLGVVDDFDQRSSVTDAADVEILSVKPWTMSATVAKRYFIGETERIILAGDAAHAFPPAGGFGMNTGLQDAHNLSWRLASLVNGQQGAHEQDNGNKKYKAIVGPYESERKSVASQNAALSVRNYNRTLEIAKACYLNADHPSLLQTVMESPPASLLPLSIRQQTFRGAVATAMMPLANLASRGNIYSETIAKNVRRILESGGGLPLLFPRYEIGFSYNNTRVLDDDDDTAGFVPQIAIGFRLPHIPVEVLQRGKDAFTDKNDQHEDQDNITTLTDIESQIQERWTRPTSPHYSLVIYSTPQCKSLETLIVDAQDWALRQCDLPLKIIDLYSDRSAAQRRRQSSVPTKDGARTVLFDVENEFGRLINTSAFVALLIRPDGHIADINFFDATIKSNTY